MLYLRCKQCNNIKQFKIYRMKIFYSISFFLAFYTILQRYEYEKSFIINYYIGYVNQTSSLDFSNKKFRVRTPTLCDCYQVAVQLSLWQLRHGELL